MNVIIAPWLQNGTVSDTAAFNRMWDVVIAKYSARTNIYFNIMNEPWAFTTTTLPNFAAAWLARYPNLSRGRVIVPGVWSDQNLCAVGRDTRLNGTLLSIHQYTLGVRRTPPRPSGSPASRTTCAGSPAGPS